MKRYLFVIGFCLLPWLAHGGVYQWVDETGRIHFGNIPPQQQDEYKTGELKSQSAPVVQKKATPAPEPSKNGVIKTASPEDKRAPLSAKNPTVDEGAKAKSVKNDPPTKFHDRKKLKTLIKDLREQVEPARASKSTASKNQPAPAPKDPQPTVLKPVEAVKVEPVVIDSPDGPAGDKAPLQSVEKKSAEQKSAEQAREQSPDDGSSALTEKDADKCGVFSDFVDSYEVKVSEGCPGAHCSVYKRSLKKYKLKKERYC